MFILANNLKDLLSEYIWYVTQYEIQFILNHTIALKECVCLPGTAELAVD